MLIRVPGMSDEGRESKQYAEFLDLLPTLAEAALGDKIPACSGDSSDTRLCTDGASLMPLLAGAAADTDAVLVKDAAFSQFDRCVGDCGSTAGKNKAAAMGLSKMSACRSRPCTMGYTMITTVADVEYRHGDGTLLAPFGAAGGHASLF